MSGFKFRLQKVLDLRVRQEQDVAARLGEARRRAEDATRALDHLKQVRTASTAHLSRAHGTGGTVGHLQNLSYVLSQLDTRIADAAAACRAAEAEVQSSLDQFNDAIRQRRVLEQLRERDLHATRSAEAQAERKQMDEIALTRHGQAGSSKGSEG